MSAFTNGEITGVLIPAGTVLAEFGPFGFANNIKPTLWISANVAAVVRVEHRNAANTANLWSHRFDLSVAAPGVTPPPFTQIDLDPGERLRLVTVAVLAGTVQGTILS